MKSSIIIMTGVKLFARAAAIAQHGGEQRHGAPHGGDAYPVGGGHIPAHGPQLPGPGGPPGRAARAWRPW